jgi:hypothetical protein
LPKDSLFPKTMDKNKFCGGKIKNKKADKLLFFQTSSEKSEKLKKFLTRIAKKYYILCLWGRIITIC